MPTGHLAQNLTQERLNNGRACGCQNPDGVGRRTALGWGQEKQKSEMRGAGRLPVTETPLPPLGQRPPANSSCGTCPGSLTIGLVAVRGLDANQDVLVQQVLGVRDNGLQLQREGHGVTGDPGDRRVRVASPDEGSAGENEPVYVVIKHI